MNKNTIFKALLVSFAFGFLSVSCSSNSLEETSDLSKNGTEIETLKNDLRSLNTDYSMSATRGWFRWLIFGAADVGGFLLGNITGATSASTLAWTVTKNDTPKTPQTPSGLIVESSDFKNSTQTVKVSGTLGQQHNTIIVNTKNNNPNLFYENPQVIINQIMDETEKETGLTYSAEDRQYTCDLLTNMMKYFDTDKTIDEYIGNLKTLAKNQAQLDGLDACAVILEGLQNVDDNDTTYVARAIDIVKKSNINPDLKKSLLDGISIADGSAKLWNTENITTTK